MAIRYPDVTFDEHSAGFLCPVCTNTCNCSHCSRNRGEEFISMRLGGLAASLFKTKVTLVRDASKDKSIPRAPSPPPSATPTPTPEPSATPMQTQFWAHVYGLEGERVGSAFMTRDQVKRLQTQGPPSVPLSQLPAKRVRKPTKRARERAREREETRKGPRVFVGRPLASWKVRAVRDLEPSVDVDSSGKGKGKGKEMEKGEEQADAQGQGQGQGTEQTTGTEAGTGTGPASARRRRCYIGHAAPLYEPYGRMPGTASPTRAARSRTTTSRCATPVLHSDRALMPLSEPEGEATVGADNWPQPEVGECCSWAPPPPLPSGAGMQGLADPCAGGLPGPGPLASDVDGVGSGTTTSPGAGAGASASGEMGDMAVDGGDDRASSRALSEEDLARAISVALAALSVDAPPM